MGARILVAPTMALAANPVGTASLGEVTFTATVTGTGLGTPTGTVSFTAGGTAIAGCGSQNLVATAGEEAQAVCTTSSLAAGTFDVVANYPGDGGSYDPASATVTGYVITEVAPTVTASASPPTSAGLGAQVTLTATVVGVGAGPAPSLGTVTFTEGVGGAAVPGCALVTLPAALECVTSGLTLGSHDIVASYDGTADPNYLNGDSAVLPYSIGEATPTVTLAGSPAGSAELGAQVTFTATVTGSAGAPSGGTVSFLEGVGGPAVPGCAAVTLPAALECVTSGLTLGSHNIVASYDGTADPNYANADSAPLSYSIAEVTPTVTLVADPAGSAGLGSSVTFTATVTGVGAGPVPSLGTVSFTEGVGGAAVPGCAPVTLLATQVECVTSGLAGGSHGIVASYDGTADPNYLNSDSAVLPYSIAEVTPTVTLVASPAGSAGLGSSVTFTATVTGVAAGPAPSLGTVSFTEGAGGPVVPGCAPVTLPAVLECVTSGLGGGPHGIVATYNGDADPGYTNDDSDPVSYVVDEAAPTVTVTASPDTSAPIGAPVTLTATATGVAGGPAPSLGSVSFTEGVGGAAVPGCAPVTLLATQVECVTSGLAGGSHGIVASYDGTADPNYVNGDSAVLPYSIAEATPTVTLVANPAGSAELGAQVTFTATVTGSVGAPSGGTVSFLEGVAGPPVPGCGPATLPATLECVTSGLTLGSHNVVASYDGTTDPNYSNADSAVVPYSIAEATPTVTLSASPAGSAELGAQVTFTATVTGSVGAPSGGTVSFLEGVAGPPVPGCGPATLP
ncbi:MAG: Ig-like domain repeat protein, partial [Labedaea sp.]